MLLAFIKHGIHLLAKTNQSTFSSFSVFNILTLSPKLKISQCGGIHSKQFRKYSNMPHSTLTREQIVCKEIECEQASNPNSYQISFKLTSYNILAQYYLDNNSYLYEHCEPHLLKWAYRWKNLLKEITNINSDIYCFQEVQTDCYEADILPQMEKLGYKGCYQAKSEHKPDGCAIFYRDSMFELIGYKGFTYFRPGVSVLGFFNAGQAALLRPRTGPTNSSGAICIGNTHLFFNPNRGDVKTAQLCMFLAEIDALARQSSAEQHHPIILCGDLNVEPFSPLYDFLLTGRMEFADNPICHLSGQNESSFPTSNLKTGDLSAESIPPPCLQITRHCVYLRHCGEERHSNCEEDSYVAHDLKLVTTHNYKSPGSKRLVTSFTSQDTCAVDHIFYSKGNGSLELVSYFSLVESQALNDIDGIPNSELSSDHIPLVTHFLYREPLK